MHGPINALAPIYQTAPLAFCEVAPQPPILWVRGGADSVVSDASMFDLGTLGQLGVVPDWPGEAIYPPQPMIAQIREALARYADRGGEVDEVTLPDIGHSPYLEAPDAFDAVFHRLLAKLA